jgi:preprotein translocase subunit SecG
MEVAFPFSPVWLMQMLVSCIGLLVVVLLMAGAGNGN